MQFFLSGCLTEVFSLSCTSHPFCLSCLFWRASRCSCCWPCCPLGRGRGICRWSCWPWWWRVVGQAGWSCPSCRCCSTAEALHAAAAFPSRSCSAGWRLSGRPLTWARREYFKSVMFILVLNYKSWTDLHHWSYHSICMLLVDLLINYLVHKLKNSKNSQRAKKEI